MDNKSYVDAVNSGTYPEDIKVPLDKPFVDHRGVIQNLWLGSSGSITFIESKEGAVRARHIHKDGDFHGTFIVSGEIKYVEGLGSDQTETIFTTGEMFFTRPEVYHEMHFITDTKMITVNGIVKNHENYEKNIVRPNK
jgi:quercetin dioxygenase-like cupin family protein